MQKALTIGILACIILSITQCIVLGFIKADDTAQTYDTGEAFEIPGECAKREDKCILARALEPINALEKEVLAENGAAIWWFDGSKYKLERTEK